MIGVVSEIVLPAGGLVLITSPFLNFRLATGDDELAVTFFQPSLLSRAMASAVFMPETSGSVCLPSRTLYLSMTWLPLAPLVPPAGLGGVTTLGRARGDAGPVRRVGVPPCPSQRVA